MGKFWDIVARWTAGMPPPPRPDAPRPRVPIVDRELRLIADLPCHRCGYDLRSLHVTQTCPECGTAVRASIRGDNLIFSDPRWLRRVANGVTWMGRAGLIGIILCGVWLFTMSAAVAIGIVTAVIGFLAGAWMATTADPSGIDEARCGVLRALARTLLCAGLLAAPTSALRGHMRVPEGMIRSATGILIAVGFAGVLAILRYFQRLTLRLPDGRLFAAVEGSFRFLFVTVVASTISVIVLNTVANAPGRLTAPVVCLMVLPMFVVIFATLRFVGICRELAEFLQSHARTAAELWPATARDGRASSLPSNAPS